MEGRGRGGGRGRGRGGQSKSPLVAWKEKEKRRKGVKNWRDKGDKGKGRKKDQEEREFGFKIMISGFDPSTSVKELIQFLQSKAESQLSISEAFKKEQKAFLLVETRTDAIALEKLSGIKFNQHKLFIKQTKYAGPSVLGEKQKGALLALVESRYNAQHRLLNLSRMAGQEQDGFRLDFNSPTQMRTLWSILAAKCPQVTTISFAGNHIRNLSGFRDLGSQVPSVQNISFEANEISDFKQLDCLKNIRVRELVFTQNPIASEMDEANYRSQVTRRFPTLQYLDRTKVEQVIMFDLPSYVLNSVLPPSVPNYFDSPSRQNAVVDFLKKYMTLYDQNRQGLLDLYADDAYFSLTVPQKTDAERARGKPFRGEDQQGGGGGGQGGAKQHLGDYIPFNRNLLRVEDVDKRAESIQVGRASIVHTLTQLPVSHHQLDSFSVDSYVLPLVGSLQLMMVHVHGHFWEVGTGVNRSFDRTFMLSPAPSGSRTQQLGFPVIITNDQLHIRHYNPTTTTSTSAGVSGSSTPTPTGVGIGVGSTSSNPLASSSGVSLGLSSPSGGVTPSFGITSSQSVTPLFAPSPASGTSSPAPSVTAVPEMVRKFTYVTDLKPEVATQYLEKNGWDYNAALTDFYSRKGQNAIPEQAFLKNPT